MRENSPLSVSNLDRLVGADRPEPWCNPRPVARQPRADRFLMRVGMLFPRRHREAILGDLSEDLKEYRQRRFSERRLVWHVIQQLAWNCIARLWSWGFWLWLGRSLWKRLAG